MNSRIAKKIAKKIAKSGEKYSHRQWRKVIKIFLRKARKELKRFGNYKARDVDF